MRKSSLLLVGFLALTLIVTMFQGVLADESYGSGLPTEVNAPKFNLNVDAVKAKHFTIGFSQCVMDHPYRINMVNTAKAMAKKYGVNLIVTDGQGKADNEVANLQTMIARKVKAIIISSHEGVAITPAIKQANDANIPVILIDGGKPFPDWNFVAWMSTDDWLLGEKAAEFMAKEIGSGKVAMIEGTPGSSCTQGRREGFLKVLAKYPDIKMVADQQANWLRLDSLNVTTNILQANPDLKAIYCHNDEMALGAVEAVKKAGKVPGKDILIYSCCDQQINMMEVIKAKEVQCTQLYVGDGGYALEAALSYLMGNKLPRMINLGSDFVTQKNVNEYKGAY